MIESADASNHPLSMFDMWMKSVNDFWSGMTTPFQASAETNGIGKDQTIDSGFWKTGLENWNSIVSAISRSAPMPSYPADTGTFSDTFIKMTEPFFSGITRMLHQWQGQPAGSMDQIIPFDFNSIDADVLKVWEKLYDHEFRRFLKAPQLGLTREHQEKTARFLDHFNKLQTAMAEFLNFLVIPFKKAHADFQQKLARLAAENELPKDLNACYRIWLKILEGHYMTLFQSPEYIASLMKTLAASAAYTRAKKELLNDLLKQLSVPSSENMDAVYRELHGLKKRVKNLEKTATNR